MGAASLPQSEALVDAIAVGVIGDNKNMAVRLGGGACEESHARQKHGGRKYGDNAHDVPEKQEAAGPCSPRRAAAISRRNEAFVGRGLDAAPRLFHGAGMNGLLAFCGLCREIMR
ncbi:hypothetical protein [Nitrobacter sp.]|uniref:hypothetical protein n=1 Tax=Nitrobacter sp. TaxID=29420 RepID=UPI003F64B851